jgi:UrcA family protein
MNRFKSIPASSFRSLALVAVLSLGSAQALAYDGSKSIKVRYSDLDLTTQAGADTLYHRIRGAARQVCGYEASSFWGQRSFRNCVNGAVGNAVATVNSPLLTALHAGTSPAMTAMLGK